MKQQNESVKKIEEEPKIHIKEAIKESTVVHCETIEEANRILGMAHELGYKWNTGDNYEDNTEWNTYKSTTCYYLFDGSYSDCDYFKNRNYTITPSIQIENFEEKKPTDWVPTPEDIEAINKKASEKLPIDKVTMKDENLNTENASNSDLGTVSGSAIKPPLGLIPKKFHNERVKAERFNEVCGAIARYYDAGLKINIEWIEEYNELVESVGKHYHNVVFTNV